ncbi:MAG TPA: hypothetical protein VFP61_01590 [Acidimicrobiales bacterium]|nr:hypothetical protein [Acidimicrobiales bacterium]
MGVRSGWFSRRGGRGVAAALAASAAATMGVLATVVVPGGIAGAAVPKAVSTTVDTAVDGSGHCLNGTGLVNCNLYDGKQYVWLSGLTKSAALDPGTYFFAVLAPGGQGSNANPNDGTPLNLSLATDDWTYREFTVGPTGTLALVKAGHHAIDTVENKINLADYQNTPNPGGEYILAVCAVPATIATTNAPGVNPSDCKYDAFKVQGGPGTLSAPGVFVSAAGTDTRTYGWRVTKTRTSASPVTVVGTTPASYQVVVTHDAGTVGNTAVTGTVTVTNSNFSGGATQPVTLSGITDILSDGTTCTVDTSAGLVLTALNTDFPLTCSPKNAPTAPLDDTATVSWAAQTVGGAALAAGSAPATVSGLTITETAVDQCVTVTDTAPGATATSFPTTAPTLCAGTSANPTTLTYTDTWKAPTTAGTCSGALTNTATVVDPSNEPLGHASASVVVCAPTTPAVASDPPTSTYTRTYTWAIDKTGLSGTVTPSGPSTPDPYKVAVTQTGVVDSAWATTGTVTVSNPGTDPITVTSVTVTPTTGAPTTSVSGASCTVSGLTAATAVIAGGSSTHYAYSCTYTSQPPAGTTMDATAAWTSANSGSATQAPGALAGFGAPTTLVNKTITPTDTFHGGAGVGLCTLATGTPCTLTAVDSAPLTSQVYSYDRPLAVPATGCTTYANTAATGLTGNGQTATATVAVCAISTDAVTTTGSTTSTTSTTPTTDVETKAGDSTTSAPTTVATSPAVAAAAATTTTTAAPTTAAGTTTTTVGAGTAPAATPTTAGGSLPFTGADVLPEVAVGAGLIGLGLLLRRRRR